jgi:hypothetical protein
MKRQLFILCMALAALTRAQDLAKPITYRTVAVPLHTALEAISNQAGFTLAPSEADQPIILSISGATTQETMDHIATAIGAEWQKQSATQFLLIRSDAMEQKIKKQTIDLREANIKKAMDRLAKQQNDGELPDERAAKTAQALASYLKLIDENKSTRSAEDAVDARYPGHRALVALLEMIPARRISELASGERLVLSTSPGEMQQQLPDSAQGVFDSFTDDQQRFAAAFAKQHPGPIPGLYGHRLETRISALTKPPAKLLLFISGPQIFTGSPSVVFVAVDENGKAVGDAR